MSILSFFEDWPQVIVAVEKPTLTVTGGKPSPGWAVVTGLSAVPCWAYRARDARTFLDDKFKNVTGLVLLFDPADLGGVPIDSTMRVTIAGVPWYLNTPDDVLSFGELVVIQADGVPHA